MRDFYRPTKDPSFGTIPFFRTLFTSIIRICQHISKLPLNFSVPGCRSSKHNCTNIRRASLFVTQSLSSHYSFFVYSALQNSTPGQHSASKAHGCENELIHHCIHTYAHVPFFNHSSNFTCASVLDEEGTLKSMHAQSPSATTKLEWCSTWSSTALLVISKHPKLSIQHAKQAVIGDNMPNLSATMCILVALDMKILSEGSTTDETDTNTKYFLIIIRHRTASSASEPRNGRVQ